MEWQGSVRNVSMVRVDTRPSRGFPWFVLGGARASGKSWRGQRSPLYFGKLGFGSHFGFGAKVSGLRIAAPLPSAYEGSYCCYPTIHVWFYSPFVSDCYCYRYGTVSFPSFFRDHIMRYSDIVPNFVVFTLKLFIRWNLQSEHFVDIKVTDCP